MIRLQEEAGHPVSESTRGCYAGRMGSRSGARCGAKYVSLYLNLTGFFRDVRSNPHLAESYYLSNLYDSMDSIWRNSGPQRPDQHLP